MTAMRAQRASETPSTANPFLRDLVASLRTVVVPGSPATYANRTALHEMGLRWDPANHRWHGTTTAGRVKELRERLGLEVRCFGDLEVHPKGPTPPKSTPPGPTLGPDPIAVPARDPARRPHDGSQTRVEARVAYPAPSEEQDEFATPGRRFSLLEVTSGLTDDSREADEREAERRLRERVKQVRAVVASTPGLAEVLAGDWRKAARFFARLGIREGMFRNGVPFTEGAKVDVTEQFGSTCDWVIGVKTQESTVLPGSDAR